MSKGSGRRPGEMPPGAWEAAFKKPVPVPAAPPIDTLNDAAPPPFDPEPTTDMNLDQRGPQ